MTKATRVYFFEKKDLDYQSVRVISAKRVMGGIELREECDQYFTVVLSKQELEAFIHELRMIVDQPEPPAETDDGA